MMRRNLNHIMAARLRPMLPMPTVRSKRQRVFDTLLAIGQWLALLVGISCLVLSTLVVISYMERTEQQLDSAFMQGMAAGSKLCPRGL